MVDRAFVDKAESIITDLLKKLHAAQLQKEDSQKTRYIRALLPSQFAPAPGEQFQHGVAFAIYPDKKIETSPYLHRQVCTNGMVLSYDSFQSNTIDARDIPDYDLPARLMDEIIACSDEKLRRKIEKDVESSLEEPGDLRLVFHRLSSFTKWQHRTRLLKAIVTRLDPWDKTSRFNIANAITSLARDTEDADLKWNLEKLGWEVLLGSDSTREAKSVKEFVEPSAFES